MPLTDHVQTIEELSNRVVVLEGHIRTLGDSSSKLREKEDALLEKNKQLSKEWTKGIKHIRTLYSEKIKLENSYRSELSNISRESNARKKLQASMGGQIGVLGKFGKVGGAVGVVITKLVSTFLKFGQALGVHIPSIKELVDSLIDYRTALMEVSMAQNIAGKGIRTLGSSLAMASDDTILSQQAFLGLVDTYNKLYIGIKPTTAKIEQFAKVMQSKIVPTTKNMIGLTEVLLRVQNKQPDLYDEIIENAEKYHQVVKNGTQDEINKFKELQELRNVTYEKRLRQIGMEQEAIVKVLKLLTERSNFEKDQAKIIEKRQQVEKKMADATLLLARAWEPAGVAMTEFWTKIIDYTKVAITETDKYLGAVNKVLTTGKITGGKEEPSKPASYLASFSKKLWAAGKAVTKEVIMPTPIRKVGSFIGRGVAKTTRQSNAVEKNALRWEKEIVKARDDAVKKALQDAFLLRKNLLLYETKKKLVGEITGYLSTQADIAKEFGTTTQGTVEKFITKQLQLYKELAIVAKNTLKTELERTGKELNLKLNLDDASLVESLEKVRKKLQDMMDDAKDSKDSKKFAEIQSRMQDIANMASNIKVVEGDAIRTVVRGWNDKLDAMTKYNSIYEGYLSSQRSLMESAQFGLGASVSMMQKQVDLANEMIRLTEETAQNAAKDLKNREGAKNLTEEQKNTMIEELSSARSLEEAQQNSQKWSEKTGIAQGELNEYWANNLKWAKGVADQQQKVYDLTKNIREGYLDAIRQMSSGAKEFTKIIGTQTRGSTQLMDITKRVTGVAKLNTMKLGGKVVVGGDGYESRGRITGEYKAGSRAGLSFLGGADQASRNKNIYRYGQTYNPTVGTAAVPGSERYTSAYRNMMGSVNIGTRTGKSPGTYPKPMANAATSGALVARLLGGSTAPSIAGGGGWAQQSTLNTGALQGVSARNPYSGAVVIIRIEEPLAGQLSSAANLNVKLEKIGGRRP